MFKTYVSILSSLFHMSAFANPSGSQTSFPIIDDLANLKRETAAVCQTDVPPENTTGLSKVICFLKDTLGATSVGFFGPIKTHLGLMQSAARVSTDTEGYSYKIDQWLFDSVTPSQTHKGVQYRFSEDGKKGRVERMDIPLANSELQKFGFTKWTAGVYEWDGSNPSAQKLTRRWQQTKNATDKTYLNTRWADYHSALIDSTTNTAEMLSISYTADSAQTYKFRSMRNSTYTLFEAHTCNATGTTCGSPLFQCVNNASKMIEAFGTTYDSVRTGNCASFSASGFTMALVEPTQENLDILNDSTGRMMTLKTDEPMQP